MNWLRITGLRVLLALGLGLGLWIFVSYTQNPDQRTTYERAPVAIENLPAGLLLVDSGGLPRVNELVVDLTVEADQETLSEVRQSDLKAFVDLSGLTPGEHVVPINVTTTRSGLSRVRISANPQNIGLRLDSEVTRTVPIEVVTRGNVPFSFIADVPQTTVAGQPVNQVLVRGPQNRVDRVLLVQAVADIDRLTANYNAPRPLLPLGENGQVVSGVEVEPVQIDVLVPIRSSAGAKRVPILPEVIGEPGAGYVVSGITVQPQFVTLTGSSGPLDQVQNARTSTVNINGITRTTTYTVSIRPPNAALIEAGEPTTATIRVEVAVLQRQFSVQLPALVNLTDVPAGFLASVNPSIVQVTLSGSVNVLGPLATTPLQARVSLRSLTAGVFQLTPTFDLPPGVSVVGDAPQVTVTLRLIPTEVPTATETLSPTPGTPTPPNGSVTPTPTPADATPEPTVPLEISPTPQP